MPTLAEYAKLSQTKTQKGVFLTIYTEDQLQKHLQYETMEGNALAYNQELALPTATTVAVGSDLSDTEPTYTQRSTSLARVYVQTPLDRYVLQTRSDVNNQEAITRMGMSKAISRRIAQLTIKGDSAVVGTEFDGLDKMARLFTRMIAMDDGVMDGPGTAETELTLDRLDYAIDQVEPGPPDILLMNKTMRRKLTALARATGSGILSTRIDEFGRQVTVYNDIPIVISDWITNAEQYADASTWPSSTATTIFPVKFGLVKEGFTLMHNGTVLTPDFQNVGIKEKRNENLYRMVVYLGSALWSTKALVALGGIDSAA
jgi:hypothetical protein